LLFNPHTPPVDRRECVRLHQLASDAPAQTGAY
jgi:hypothetical protein